MSNIARNKQEVMTQAEKEGFEVVRSDPYNLLLDLDNGTDMNAEIFTILQAEIPGTEISDAWTSKDGKGKHVVIRLPIPINSAQRFALQACLGSDAKREALGVLYEIRPSMLFKPKKDKKDG